METQRPERYEVVRPFSGGYRAGDILDATTWPSGRAQRLVDQRYLRPVPAEPGDARQPSGRRRIDDREG